MAVLAKTSEDLLLNVFENETIIKNVSKHAVSNNIIYYIIGTTLYRRDLLTGISEELEKFECKILEIKISENGKFCGVFLSSSELIIYNENKQIRKIENVNTFEISSSLIGYEDGSNLVFRNMESMDVIYKYNRKYKKYLVFDDFALICTDKTGSADKESNCSLLKVTKAKTEILGQFDSLLDMRCVVSKDKKYALINLSTSYAKNNYYATTVLYLLNVETSRFTCLEKLSKILDFTFIRKGFCVVYGNQPANATCFDYDLNVIDTYPKGTRNRVYFNKDQSYVVFAGFDQLPGDIEIYNVETKEKSRSFNELGATKIRWDNTGSYFYVSILSYIKDSNRMSKYDYHGRKIEEKKYNCLVDTEVYGTEESFIKLEKIFDPCEETDDEVYVPVIPKNRNIPKKPVIKRKDVKKKENKPKEYTFEELQNMYDEIQKNKQRVMNNELLTPAELNMMIFEDDIIKMMKEKKRK